MALSTRQIVVITASLALVGGATAYVIYKKDDLFGPPAPPKKLTPSGKGHKKIARQKFPPGSVPHGRQFSPPMPPYGASQSFMSHATHPQQQQHAFVPRAPTPQPQYDVPPQHVDYYPTPMPPLQPAAAHEWPRQSPAGHDQAPAPQPVSVEQSMNPTYWRDIASSLGILPKDLLKVQDAQDYLNKLGAVPHGEVLKVDNDLGTRTRNALTDFQEKHHIPMTGKLDPETGAAILYDAYQMYRAQAAGAAA